jgi:hypothetical protein
MERKNHKKIQQELSYDNLSNAPIKKGYRICPIGSNIGKWSRTYSCYPCRIRIRESNINGGKYMDIHYYADYNSTINDLINFVKKQKIKV